MTQKPLSHERREEIVRLVKAYPIMPMDGSAGYLYAIADLLADAEFWRNKVKIAKAWNDAGCNFCEADGSSDEHTLECAWALAQR